MRKSNLALARCKLKMIPRVDFKGIRARVIEEHMTRSDYMSAVCFSCGNAARALAKYINVLEIGPRGDFQTKRWWTPEQIHELWPLKFDATPGHLPLFLMLRIAMRIRDIVGWIQDTEEYPGLGLAVPTGSGESIMCMHLAYPTFRFIAVYDDNSPSTSYFCGAPLSNVVQRFFAPVYIKAGEINEYKIRWPDATPREAVDG